jgi:hypothetical protein
LGSASFAAPPRNDDRRDALGGTAKQKHENHRQEWMLGHELEYVHAIHLAPTAKVTAISHMLATAHFGRICTAQIVARIEKYIPLLISDPGAHAT